MKLTRIEARDFLSFGEPGLVLRDLSDRTVIVGPNSSGKTNIFRVLDFVSEAFTRSQPDPYLVRRAGASSGPVVLIGLKLSPGEVEAAVDWMLIHAKAQQLNQRNNEQIDLNGARSLSELLVDKLRGVFRSIFSGELRFVAIGTGNPAQPYTTRIEIEPGLGLPTLIVSADGNLTRSLDTRFGGFPLDLRWAVLEELMRDNPNALRLGSEFVRSPQELLETVSERLTPAWLAEKLQNRGATPVLIDVRPQDLSMYESQLGGRASDALTLRRFLIGRRWALQNAIGLTDLLRLILITSIDKLANYQQDESHPDLPDPNTAAPGHTLLGGTGLTAGLYYLKNSSDLSERSVFEDIRQAFKLHSGGLHLDVVLETYVSIHGAPGGEVPLWIPLAQFATGSQRGFGEERFVSVPSIRFGHGGFEFSVASAAAGLSQLLAVIVTALGGKDVVLFVDEPEVNLYPAKQREILALLVDEAERRGNQIFIVTHSPHFVDPRRVPDILRLRSGPSGSDVSRPLLSQPGDAERMARRFERTPMLLEALFSGKVILVEGGSEAAALQVWINKLLAPTTLSGLNIEIIDVGGDGGFEPIVPILRSWAIPFRVVSDSDSASAIQPFGLDGYAYPKPDFSNILEDECAAELGPVKAEIRSKSGSKATAVAREVAHRAAPPPTVIGIWSFLKPFVES